MGKFSYIKLQKTYRWNSGQKFDLKIYYYDTENIIKNLPSPNDNYCLLQNAALRTTSVCQYVRSSLLAFFAFYSKNLHATYTSKFVENL